MTESGAARYRAGMAELLRASLAQTGHIEQGFGVSAGARESAQGAFEDEPTGVFGVMCAMLLRKARSHGIAVLRANDHSNAHSLGVQMRPVLECAGQVVLTFHNLMIETERAEETVGGYLNADFYQTVIREMKGGVSHDQLLQSISQAGGNREDGRRPPSRQTWPSMRTKMRATCRACGKARQQGPLVHVPSKYR